MIAHILNEAFVHDMDFAAEPRCGEDFCDGCGDCLACYEGGLCPDGGHRWIVHPGDEERWLARHRDAVAVPARRRTGDMP